MTAESSLRKRLRARFKVWINNRIPPARTVTLNRKRIFIFPTRVGFFFGLSLVPMLVTAVNYQNNMSFALTFLLATLFIIAVLHTYANLSGLTVTAVRAQPAFPGQQSEFELGLERSVRREHFGLNLHWPQSTEMVVNLVEEDSAQLHFHTPVEERGWYHPGRLRIESVYPLGLLRCWTWVDLDLYALVYPKPLPSPELPGLASDRPDGAAVPVAGSDDFYGFRDYQRGDSLRQVHWKGMAKGQAMQVKQYGAYADRSVWLDWEAFAGLPDEQRLSHLCYWALHFDSANEEYGLRLPGVSIEPGVGEKQRERVLKELALYGKPRRAG